MLRDICLRESVGEIDKSHVSNHVCSFVNFKMLYADSLLEQIKKEHIWKEIYPNYPCYVYNDVKMPSDLIYLISNRIHPKSPLLQNPLITKDQNSWFAFNPKTLTV